MEQQSQLEAVIEARKQSLDLDQFEKQIEGLIGIDVKSYYQERDAWVNKNIQNLEEIKDRIGINNITYDAELLHKTLECVYLLHHKQKRKKKSESYLVHLEQSLENFLSLWNKEEEEKIFPEHQGKIFDFNSEFILTLLHDGPEDFFANIDGPNDLSKKQELYTNLIVYLSVKFGKDIALALVLIFAKLSKRIVSEESLNEGNSSDVNLTKTDIGRLDFLARAIAVLETRNSVSLILTLAEKEHNLESPERMHERKFIEIYNLAILLFGSGLRYHGRILMTEIYEAYVHDKNNSFVEEKVLKDFQRKVVFYRRIDHEHFNKISKNLTEDLNEIYGENNYKLIYHPLDDWRIHEIMMYHYYRENPKKQPAFGEDVIREHFITEEAINDPKFIRILNRLFLGRILVVVNDDCNDRFEEQRTRLKFKQFKIQPQSKVDYYNENDQGTELLCKTGYKAIRFAIQSKDKRKKSQPLEVKILTAKDHQINEYGQVSFQKKREKDGEDICTLNYSPEPLEKFCDYLAEHIGREKYEQFKGFALNPLGCNFYDKDIFKLLKGISNKIKELKIDALLSTGGKRHS